MPSKRLEEFLKVKLDMNIMTGEILWNCEKHAGLNILIVSVQRFKPYCKDHLQLLSVTLSEFERHFF